ncbi:(2Fe-2S) ferredoxin [Nitratireductor aestuarii]|uniref:(2Fe-2S) ferredoxin n=1 Tax=Nitratireductor aestuarii TaxID=1735103 RepID=A0A916RJ83_9HYPH|nr:2Fe-2S iron-sulfur cluster-binding protein [Nitratireductor aestuarii]GGA58116.1 (2Fe-2S) ferredoxin [Nitratireductor aestuarii]
MSGTVTIFFETPQGLREVGAKIGASVMETAVMNNVSGIEAECGGACICATCHVYTDKVPQELLQPMSSEEDDMLDMATAERRSTSRLSCQLRVTAELENTVFIIPESQF